MNTRHFISEEALARFSKQYFPRTVVPEDQTVEPWRLERIYNIIKKGRLAQRFECYCIQVEEDDGASWAAEKVNQTLLAEQKDPKGLRFTVNALATSRPGEFPVIARITGRERFVRLARKHRLTNRFRILGDQVTFIYILCSIAAAGILTMLSSMSALVALALFVSLIILGFIIRKQQIESVLKETSRSSQALIEDLNQAAVTPNVHANYQAFILDLVQEMKSLVQARFVIIDKWSKIDRTSQAVIQQYFSVYYQGGDTLTRTRLPEFWIVFEDTYGDQFSQGRWQTLKWEDTAYRNVQSFKIQLLSPEERQKLGDRLSLPPRQLKHKVIKRICHDDQLAVSFEKKFRSCRREHPKNKGAEPDAIDFLYLLSLTHTPVSISFTPAEVETMFVKDRVRTSILKFCLQIPNLPADVKKFYLSQQPEWEDTVESVSKNRNITEWKIRPEVCEAISRVENELDLPDRRYGHLFWAAYWRDRLSNHPYQSAWFSKLSYHLKESEAPKLQRYNPVGNQDESRENILRRVFDDYMFTIEGCLRTCVFEHVQVLLEDAFEVLLELKGLDTGYLNKLNRLLIRVWEVYAITLDDYLLHTIRSINKEIYATVGVEQIPSDQPDILETFYYDTMPLPMEERVNSKDHLYCLPPQRTDMYESMLDYMRVRSAWLVLMSEKVFRIFPMLKLPRATDHAVSYLEKTYPKLHERLEQNAAMSGRLNLLDLMTVSNAVWCFGLHMREQWLLSSAMRNQIGPNLNELGRFMYEKNNVLERADYFLSNIEKTVQRAFSLKSARFEKPIYLENEFFFNVILSEIASNALGALTLTYHNTPYLFAMPESNATERINNLVRLVAHSIDYNKLMEITSVQDLESDRWVSSVDEFMELTGLIWRRLGLDEMYQFMNIRRIQFNTVCRSAGLRSRFETLTKTANLIHGHPTIDFFANLSKANFRADSREMQSLFVQTAAQVAIDNRFSEDVVRDLCVSISLYFADTEHDLDDFVGIALSSPKKGMNSIRSILGQVDESDLTMFYLNIYNLLNRLKSKRLVEEIEDTLNASISDIQDASVRYELQQLNQYFALKKVVGTQDQKLNTDNIIQEWKGNESGIWYPAVLRLCLLKGAFTETLNEACAQVFRSEIRDESANTYLLLAFHYVRKLMDLHDEEKIEYPMRYLEQADRFANINSADVNKEIYLLLAKSSYTTPSKRAYFGQRAQYWIETMIERDSLRFQGFLQTSSYFHVFQDIFEKMAGYGLQVEGSLNDNTLLAGFPSTIPSPIVQKGLTSLISADFLNLGRHLYNENAMQNAEMDEPRRELNAIAQNNLNPLLNLIDQVPDLPGYAKEITSNYRKSISEHNLTMPDLDG